MNERNLESRLTDLLSELVGTFTIYEIFPDTFIQKYRRNDSVNSIEDLLLPLEIQTKNALEENMECVNHAVCQQMNFTSYGEMVSQAIKELLQNRLTARRNKTLQPPEAPSGRPLDQIKYHVSIKE